jgi:exodeoxyribonuclease VII small subunit
VSAARSDTGWKPIYIALRSIERWRNVTDVLTAPANRQTLALSNSYQNLHCGVINLTYALPNLAISRYKPPTRKLLAFYLPPITVRGLLMPKNEPTGAEISFETAMERLERIVEEMESSKLPLEELLLRYEEGIRLVGVCNQHLAGAENRIETLNRAANGRPQPSGGANAQDTPKDSNKTKNEEIRLF